MDIDFNKEAFCYVDLPNIIGALGNYTLKDFEIHIDFKNKRIALIN